MQVIADGLLFVAGVVALVYIPGKVALSWPKPALSPLEDLTLSLVLGLIVSGCVYWAAAYCGGARFYFLWPLGVSAFFVFFQRERLAKLRRFRLTGGPPKPEAFRHVKWQGQHRMLGGVILFGILTLAVLPQYYSNFTFDASGGLTRVDDFPDAVFHMAIANELTHSVPPQAPVFSGRALNYHYGMDLPVAMFARATGLDTRDLTVRFAPTLLLVLAMLATFCFSRTWLGSGRFGALTTFLVFFGEDFSFIPGVMLGWKGDWSLAFGVPSVYSLFFTNPMLPAVGLLFTALFCMLRYMRERRGAWLVLSALVLAAVMEVKVFTAVHLMASLGIASVLYLLVFRDSGLFKVAALTAILAVPFLFATLANNDQGARILVTFDPWPYVSLALQDLGMADRITSLPAFICIALPIYLVGCLGLRVIAIPGIFTDLFRPSRESGLRFMLAVFVVAGIVLTLTLRIVPKDVEGAYNNSVWFFAQSKYVAWVFVVEVLQRFYRYLAAKGFATVRVGAAIAVATAGLTVPSAVQHFMQQFSRGNTVYGREAVATAAFIAQHAKPGTVVLVRPELLDPVLALTKCRTPVGHFDAYLALAADRQRRQIAYREFWAAWARAEVRNDLLREMAVDYVAAARLESGFLLAPGPRAVDQLAIPSSELGLVYENTEYAVFQVQRNPAD